MEYRIAYLLWGIVIPVMVLISSFAFTLLIAIYLKKRKYSTVLILTPLIIWPLVLSYVLAFVLSGIWAPLDAATASKENRRYLVGRVEKTLPYAKQPFYLTSDGSWTKGHLITIHSESYFIPDNAPEVGQWVEIEYTEQEHAVLNIHPLSEEQGKLNETTGRPLFELTGGKDIEFDVKAGSTLYYTGIIMILVSILGRTFFGPRYMKLLHDKDFGYRNGVRPNMVSILVDIIPLLWFELVIVGLSIGWNSNDYLLFTVVLIALGFIPASKLFSSLELDGEWIIYKSIGKTQRFHISTVSQISWDYEGKNSQNGLRIAFINGLTLFFAQQYYLGLHNFARQVKMRK